MVLSSQMYFGFSLLHIHVESDTASQFKPAALNWLVEYPIHWQSQAKVRCVFQIFISGKIWDQIGFLDSLHYLSVFTNM